MLECFRPCKDGVMIDIWVTPNSKKDGLMYDEGSKRLRVWTREPAIKGRANNAVLRKFSGIFGNCELVSGKLSRRKTILINGVSVDDAKRMLK
jgi:uncharacterized protein (TIGR00251 family)